MTTKFHDERSAERLAELHKREEEELARVLSMKYGVEYADLSSKSIDTDALKLISEEDARKTEIAPFRKIGKRMFVAMRSPERADSLQAIQNLEKLGYQVRRFMVSKQSLEHAWDRYGDLSYATETEAGVLTISNESIQQMLSELKRVQDVAGHVNENIGSKDTHRISRVLEIIMAGALSLGASDVHLEPEEAGVRMRYRLDGVWWRCSPLITPPTDSCRRVSNCCRVLN
jgi:type IV pilus assembly protein PilB